jgi:hypothetical protein
MTTIQQEYEKVLEYETETYKLKFPVSCETIDSQIIEIESRIAELAKKNIQGLSQFEKNTLNALLYLRPRKKLEFFKYDCANVLESKKLTETKTILDTEFQKTDKDIVPKSTKNQNILFGIGGIIILVTLFIIVKPKTK